MTKTTWPARLTPFTGGAALALLILGLVVHPAQAMTPVCAACMAYWGGARSLPIRTKACAGLTNPYAHKSCMDGFVWEKCVKSQPPALSICLDATTANPGYTDCASEYCSFVSCNDGDEVGSTCTGFCNNCAADINCNSLQRPAGTLPTNCHHYCGCGNP